MLNWIRIADALPDVPVVLLYNAEWGWPYLKVGNYNEAAWKSIATIPPPTHWANIGPLPEERT